MDQVISFLVILLTVYTICIIAWALISFLPLISPQLAYNEMVVSARRFLDSVVNPYVDLFRKLGVPVVGGWDLAPIAAILVLQIVRTALDNM